MLDKINSWVTFIAISALGALGMFYAASMLTGVLTVKFSVHSKWQVIDFIALFILFISWFIDLWTWWRFWHTAEWEEDQGA